MHRSSHAVPFLGTFTYDQDLYQRAMGLKREELLKRVLANLAGNPAAKVAATRLPKAHLAAMCAEWDTGARDNGLEPGGAR